MSITVSALSEPIKQRFGLLESVTVETVSDDRWQYGEDISFVAEPCGPASVFALGECIDGEHTDPYGEDGKPVSDLAYGTACGVEVVYGSRCSARTLVDPALDVRGTASRGLACKEGIALEKAVWSSLAGGGGLDCVDEVTDVCPDPVKPFQAISAIENAFCDCGGLGVIHVPIALLNHLCDCVDEVDGVLRTRGGSIVIAGQGYGDTSGDGSFSTIYGTGRVRLFRGEERFSPDATESERLAAVNQARNLVEWRAERSWAIGFDPCCGPFKASALFC